MPKYSHANYIANLNIFYCHSVVTLDTAIDVLRVTDARIFSGKHAPSI